MLVHNPLIRPAISWQVVALGGFTQTCVAHRFDENGIFTYKFTIKINQRQVNMPSSIVSETWLLRGFWKHSFFWETFYHDSGKQCCHSKNAKHFVMLLGVWSIFLISNVSKCEQTSKGGEPSRETPSCFRDMTWDLEKGRTHPFA